jgi:hypothetical protein
METEAAADRFASALLLPRRAFAREFGTKKFAWEHVFHLKRRWRVSAAAIIRRAYDLGLLNAVGYRQAYKYMSFKGWRTKGEPFEPAFQPPELLATAMGTLGVNIDFSLASLCADLHFLPNTFKDVTGISVPRPTTKSRDVIPFSPR